MGLSVATEKNKTKDKQTDGQTKTRTAWSTPFREMASPLCPLKFVNKAITFLLI
jgi:hypothetical protein